MNAPDEHRAPKLSLLWPALRTHATKMHFFRFCELLEHSAPNRPPLGSTDSLADEPIRFRSQRGLGFPGREIETVESDPDDPTALPTVRTTFLGFYGVDARMPSYFVDEIAQRHEGAEPLAAFLDIFHHRVVTQYFRIWRKYRYPVGFARDGRDPISTYLLSLAGLGLGTAQIGQGLHSRKLLSMLGLVNQKTRTAEGLAGVLQHAVPDAVISVKEFHPIWVITDSVGPMPLGEQCVLGGGFFDRSHCVRIVIALTSRDSVTALMPGMVVHEDIMALLRFYLGYEAQAVIEMEVPPALMPPPILESGALSLGYTAMLPHAGTTRTPSAPIRVQIGTWGVPSRLP